MILETSICSFLNETKRCKLVFARDTDLKTPEFKCISSVPVPINSGKRPVRLIDPLHLPCPDKSFACPLEVISTSPLKVILPPFSGEKPCTSRSIFLKNNSYGSSPKISLN